MLHFSNSFIKHCNSFIFFFSFLAERVSSDEDHSYIFRFVVEGNHSLYVTSFFVLIKLIMNGK